MQKRFLGIGNVKGVPGWCNGGQGVGIDSMGYQVNFRVVLREVRANVSPRGVR